MEPRTGKPGLWICLDIPGSLNGLGCFSRMPSSRMKAFGSSVRDVLLGPWAFSTTDQKWILESLYLVLPFRLSFMSPALREVWSRLYENSLEDLGEVLFSWCLSAGRRARKADVIIML